MPHAGLTSVPAHLNNEGEAAMPADNEPSRVLVTGASGNVPVRGDTTQMV